MRSLVSREEILFMIIFIYGGSGSGKSAYAESRVVKFDGDKYYIATMQVYDEEGISRVNKHRSMRDGKGFITKECPKDIDKLAYEISGNGLIECMSNLVANEMFDSKMQVDAQAVIDKIYKAVVKLDSSLDNMVIVSNNVFEDGKEYDASTREYLDALAGINIRLAAYADEVYEVVAGIPVKVK